VARGNAARRDPDDWAAVSAEDRHRIDAIQAQLDAERPSFPGQPEDRSVVVRRVAVAGGGVLVLAALGLGYATVKFHPRQTRVVVAAPGAVAPIVDQPNSAPATVSRSIPAARPSGSLDQRPAVNAPRVVAAAASVPDRPTAATSEVRAGFEAWVESMRDRQLSRHLVWYADPVHVFYDRPNVPKRVVETIRSETFRDAVRAEVGVSKLDVRLDREGTAATIVFRKQFDFEGPRIDRHGTVMQELQWQRTRAGWRIVSERDLKQASRE
jgi:hypothetical protein